MGKILGNLCSNHMVVLVMLGSCWSHAEPAVGKHFGKKNGTYHSVFLLYVIHVQRWVGQSRHRMCNYTTCCPEGNKGGNNSKNMWISHESNGPTLQEPNMLIGESIPSLYPGTKHGDVRVSLRSHKRGSMDRTVAQHREIRTSTYRNIHFAVLGRSRMGRKKMSETPIPQDPQSSDHLPTSEIMISKHHIIKCEEGIRTFMLLQDYENCFAGPSQRSCVDMLLSHPVDNAQPRGWQK